MKFIRPYGQSVTNSNERKIVVNGDFKDNACDNLAKSNEKKEEALNNSFKRLQSINEHFKNQQKIYLGAVISTLDKIISKPAQGKKCPENIHNARQKIADALWKKLKDDKLNGITKEVWQRRIEPYEIDKKDGGKKYYGRWFRRFCGADADINNLDNDKIADKISEHLFEHEYRFFIKENSNLEADVSKYKKGRLERIANTISSNHLRKNLEKKETIKASKESISLYFYKQKILSIEILYDFYTKDKEALKKYRDNSKKYYDECEREPVKENRKKKKPSKNKLEFSDENILNKFKESYTKLFNDEKIVNLIKKTHKNNNVFLAHEAVRDFYIALLRSYRAKVEAFYKSCKDKKGNVPEFNIDNNIPKDVKGLLKKLKLKEDNKDINAQIRLGKIIHYTNVCPTNTDAIKNSHYWTSTGQTEIKRSEAFVKSWFNFITFASHSLRYISNHDAFYPTEDVLGTKRDNLEQDDFSKKINLVLGEKHGFEKDIVTFYEFVRTKLYALRNSTFHFKGIDEVAKKLKEKSDVSIKDIIKEFYTKDEKTELTNLWETLVSVKIGEHLNKEQIEGYWQELTQKITDISIVTLPKFRSFLKCVDNFHNFKKTGITFIAPPKAGQQKSPDWQCAYQLMQNLYEKPFSNWFQRHDNLKDWIKKAKADLEQIQKNEKDDVFPLTEFPECDDFSEYLYKLDGLASQNGSMQNGYASDKKAQKKKANAIERFKIYVLKHAFNDYLVEKNFKYLCDDKLIGQSGHNPTNLPKDTEGTKTEQWQQELYLLFHFVPVGIACDLEHQFKKYAVTFMRLTEFKEEEDFSIEEQKKHISKTKIDDTAYNNKTKVENNKFIKDILQVFELYRNNNDAKFTGNENNDTSKKQDDILPVEIEQFYTADSDYKRAFNLDNIDKNQKQVQRRHLREFVRFGVSEYLLNIAKKAKITKEQIDDYIKKSENIALWQLRKTELHDDWVKQKDNFSSEKKKEYKELLPMITAYNQLDNQVRLVDFRKIHKLVMQILGRLVGYSFMYERDLYFITLAYFHDNQMDNSKQKEFFGNCEKRLKNRFKVGQVLTALSDTECPHPEDAKKCKTSCKPINIPNHIQKILDMGINKQKIENHIRNEFAHFDMLIEGRDFNITTYINNARQLMAYDRKLKNAVAKSIKTIFDKEGINISFSCDNNHALKRHNIEAQPIYHLGTKPLKEEEQIKEPKHSKEYIEMIKQIMPSKA